MAARGVCWAAAGGCEVDGAMRGGTAAAVGGGVSGCVGVAVVVAEAARGARCNWELEGAGRSGGREGGVVQAAWWWAGGGVDGAQRRQLVVVGVMVR